MRVPSGRPFFWRDPLATARRCRFQRTGERFCVHFDNRKGLLKGLAFAGAPERSKTSNVLKVRCSVAAAA